MKRYSAVIHFLNWLMGVAAGAAIFYLGIVRWQSVAKPSPAVLAAVGGGALILFIDILWLFLRILTSRSVTYLIFEKEGTGSLKVSVDAIEDALTRSIISMPEIVSATIELKLEKGGRMPGHAVAHCVLTDVRNIFGVQESARQAVSTRYQDIFPNEQLQIEIIVERLQSEAPAKHKVSKKKKKPDDGSFTGPKYPIKD